MSWLGGGQVVTLVLIVRVTPVKFRTKTAWHDSMTWLHLRDLSKWKYYLITQNTTTVSGTACKERVRSRGRYILRRQRLLWPVFLRTSLFFPSIKLEALSWLLGVQRVLISQRHWKTRSLVPNWRASTHLLWHGMYIVPRMVGLPSGERYVIYAVEIEQWLSSSATDCCTYMWNMRFCSFQTTCLSSMLVYRLLARRTRHPAFEGCWS